MDYDYLPQAQFKFDDLTRGNLVTDLEKAFSKSQNKYDCHDRARLFVSILEGFAESYHWFGKVMPEKQERRRERLLSIANHLESIVDQLNRLDDAASEYACFLSFNELVKLENPDHVTPDYWALDDMVACASFIESMPQTLTAFANGIKAAEKTLPLHSYNTSGKDANWYLAPPQLGTAIALERKFWEFGLKYTVTNTGLAAKCLQAIYSHAGIEVERVDYWLKQARDHKDSMHNLIKGQNKSEK